MAVVWEQFDFGYRELFWATDRENLLKGGLGSRM
jgi:hypothetical protein